MSRIIKYFLFLVVVFVSIVLITDNTYAQICPHGSCPVGTCCWPQRRLDVGRCVLAGGNCGRVWTLPWPPNVEPCNTAGVCRTSSTTCSSDDSCVETAWDYLGNATQCGWNGVGGCISEYCGACSYDGCCDNPPACNCPGWNNQGCGAGGCLATQMYQTRTCNPPGCGDEAQCVFSAACAAPACFGMVAPSNPSETNLTANSVTLNWTAGSGGTLQLVRVGPNQAEVNNGCPGGVGAPPLCAVRTNVATGVGNYDTGAILNPNTTYYWRIVEYDAVSGDWLDFNNTCRATGANSTSTFATSAVSCTITPQDVNLTGVGDIGLSLAVPSAITPPYSILNVLFSVTGPPNAQVRPSPPSAYSNPDPSVLYQVEMEALGLGNTTYRALATLNDPGATTCFDDANINIANPSGWWQVQEGDVVCGNMSCNISSDIPATATNPYLINYTDSPGIAVFGGTVSVGSGMVSQPVPPFNWTVDVNPPGKPYATTDVFDYDFFFNRIPDAATPNATGNTINNINDLTNAGSLEDGYYWNTYDGGAGNLTIDSITVGIDQKVVLFVDNADVSIDGSINLIDGRGFFILIVRQNISLTDQVGAGVGPHLEGLYVANGTFDTGAHNVDLHVRGSVVGLGGISLNRNLPDNSTDPAELFEYAFDQAFFFPKMLGAQRLLWREVAP